MKDHKLLITLISASVAVAAAVTAVIIFREELAELFADIKGKLEEKKNRFAANGEFSDYADI